MSPDLRYLPIHIDTASAKIVIAGGEGAAEAKLRTLIKTEAKLHLFSPNAGDEIQRWADAGKLKIHSRDMVEADLDGATLVYAATEDMKRDAEIADWAKLRNLPVNAADQKDSCSFITPALVDRSPVTVSIGTEGTSPGLARAIKANLEQKLPENLGGFACKVLELRTRLKTVMPSIADRQRVWATVFGGDLDSKLRLSEADLESRFGEAVEGTHSMAGQVYIVGAGPGDPGLLTREAQRVLHSADVIIYDRLVSQDVLDLARREAEYIYVGKDPTGISTRQERINELLVEHGRSGAYVVRLKSGDPLIFGRANEEISTLKAAGVAFAIVPGITAASAAAAEIGVSLTSRGTNMAVQFVTGHGEDGFAELDWQALAKPDARAAIYMGIRAARFIQGRLLLHGAAAQTPVTLVENVSRDSRRVLTTSLQNLPRAMTESAIRGPAIMMLGYSPRETVERKASA